MATTPAGQQYLKVIYQLAPGGEPIGTSALAERLGVAVPSASGMVRRLEQDGLLRREHGRGVVLTAEGEREALQAVRRHRLLETFLHHVLGFHWDEVHAEAEHLEAGATPALLARIEAVLGHPTVDPHGDPIPPADLVGHRETWPGSLLVAPAGTRFRVTRVSDRDPEALRYVAECGLRPGEVVEVARLDPFDGPLWVRAGGEERAVSRRLAALVFGSVLDERPARPADGQASPAPR